MNRIDVDTRVGIVLKKYLPAKRKIAVLDKELGMVEYVPMKDNICLGALIHYRVQPTASITFIHDIENISVPMLLAQQDILFFHHVLELCYYFVPDGGGSTELFSLIEYLYRPEQTTLSMRIKKLFLVKFFAMIGMYPEEQQFQTPHFHRVASTSIDIVIEQDLDLGIESDVDAWLRSCVCMHPYVDKFKTVHFLDESRLT